MPIRPRFALPLLAPLALTATTVLAGQAQGTIDGHAVDVRLDCSGWQGPFLSAASTDADVTFNATLYKGMNKLAVTYKTAQKRYQLLFPLDSASATLKVTDTFRDAASGDSYEASLSLDCSG